MYGSEMTEQEKILDLQDRLQAIRVRDLLTERAAAREIGVNKQCLNNFIAGEVKPQFVTLAKIERWVKMKEEGL
jgi:DNA-binding XRE family transcriptional regulator